MSEYPIQVDKVQAPPLRDDILTRDRLLDWLNVKIHNRVVLLIAEAGYGKTTLLADFARRTRVRVLWYRLDRGDRDWVGFIAYLVAAVRTQQPDFGPRTAALLRETGSTAPPLETVLDTFLRELADLPPEPTVLILDDFHLVDDSDAIGTVVQELLARASERLSFILASRRPPRLRLARLRSLGEVAELARDDLRFDADEIAQLLTADAPDLEGRLLAEVGARTEGWPASVQLIKAAILGRDRDKLRAFVEGLLVAESPLYDYLAEEVVANLPPALQSFLMRASVLDSVTPELAAVAAETTVTESKAFVEQGRSYGLLGRTSARASSRELRFHPLVREFLRNRLANQLPRGGLNELHRRIAVSLEGADWQRACQHYIEADAQQKAIWLVTDHLNEVLGRGAFQAADEILRKAEAGADTFPALVVGARVAQQRGNVLEAVDLAAAALRLEPESLEAAMTLMATRTSAGDVPGAIEAARLVGRSAAATGYGLASAYARTLETSVAGSIATAIRDLEALDAAAEHQSNPRYRGVTLSNLALMHKAIGDASSALAVATGAIASLAGTSSNLEQVSARLVRGWALAHLGDIAAARTEGREALERASRSQRLEVASEVAEVEFYYGDFARAADALDGCAEMVGDGRDEALLLRAQLLARTDPGEANQLLQMLPANVFRNIVAFEARRQIAVAYLAWARQDEAAAMLADAAAEHARKQAASLWERYARLVSASSKEPPTLSREVGLIGQLDPACLSMAADILATRLDDLAPRVGELVQAEIERRPGRWLPWLRESAAGPSGGSVARRTLAGIGERTDVGLLYEVGRKRRDSSDPNLAKTLARRLAPQVRLLDLGRVRVSIGDRFLDGSVVRRKVLALLCYLTTKPGLSASREDVTEALWPDLDPDDALNSLNQTAYFLRRVFEPAFKEQVSPGYLRQDTDTIWLDPELVGAESVICRAAINSMPSTPSIEDAARILTLYPAPFALDFAYEDWATRYRDPLHASVLRIVQEGTRRAIADGRFGDAIGVAERALLVEPDADEIQGSLVHLYRLVGAHAAAAEQYGHYVETLNALGIEAPPLTEVGQSLV